MLQIWRLPGRLGLAPGYEQTTVTASIKGRTGRVGSQNGRDGSITINLDVNLYAARFGAGETSDLPVQSGRLQWVQVARGEVLLHGVAVLQGDGAAIANENDLILKAEAAAEIPVFDMAA